MPRACQLYIKIRDFLCGFCVTVFSAAIDKLQEREIGLTLGNTELPCKLLST